MDQNNVNLDEYKIMRLGPKYKIARRLGAELFEKTQTQKFALRQQNKTRSFKPRAKTTYGVQLLEKQKVRFTYILSEKQFVKYVNKVTKKSVANPTGKLYEILERRIDNVVLRAGFATTRSAARQMVSHGHILVNGVRTTIPSYDVKNSDILSIRESSKTKPLFESLEERLKETTPPTWIKVDPIKKEITTKGEPVYTPSQTHFDLSSVLQFYKR